MLRNGLLLLPLALIGLHGSAAAGAPGGFALHACVVQGVPARCATFVVPENRAKPDGRSIGLRVVVLPAWSKPVAKDAVTYLAGGPGAAATKETSGLYHAWSALNAHHDILLVDQRGTGRSNAYSCPDRTRPFASKGELRAYTLECLAAFGGDLRQYGTRMAMEDLDAVRAALGYPQLDVVGGSYGATAALVYARLHPSSVRTLTLEGATAVDVPFFAHYAANAQRALDQVAAGCRSEPGCRKAYPGWERRLGQLVEEWNAHPVRMANGVTISGDELAAVVHRMLLDAGSAASIPFVVHSAAEGDLGPLAAEGPGDLNVGRLLMAWSIWCNEPWTGLNAVGPWGTPFDGYTAAYIAAFRQGCTFIPRRAEPRSLWALPSASRIPVLVFEGGADPQDPVSNLGDLTRHFPTSRVVVLPRTGHHFSVGGCVGEINADFVDRGTTAGLDTARCAAATSVLSPTRVLAGFRSGSDGTSLSAFGHPIHTPRVACRARQQSNAVTLGPSG